MKDNLDESTKITRKKKEQRKRIDSTEEIMGGGGYICGGTGRKYIDDPPLSLLVLFTDFGNCQCIPLRFLYCRTAL